MFGLGCERPVNSVCTLHTFVAKPEFQDAILEKSSRPGNLPCARIQWREIGRRSVARAREFCSVHSCEYLDLETDNV